MNLYGYAGGDPINNSDPFGLCCFVHSPAITKAVVDAATPPQKTLVEKMGEFLSSPTGRALTGAMTEWGQGGTSAPSGSIYRVPGSATSLGRPYIGRHNGPNPAATRRSADGRDRTQAVVIDGYDAADVQAGRVAEQKQIDAHGLENLDNKRNEIAKPRKP